MRKLTIAEAGTELRKTYNQVLRLVMLGRLEGGRDAQGRWWVDAKGLERYRREQLMPAAQPRSREA